MAGSLLPQPKQVAFDSAMNPGIAYQFYTYDTGTLTPKATYQDAALTIANTNPVIANARGEVVMYGTGLYRVILNDSLGNTIYDRDPIGNPDLTQGGASLVGFLQAGSGTKSRSVQAKLRDYDASLTDFGQGDGVTTDAQAVAAAEASSFKKIYVPADVTVTGISLTKTYYGPGKVKTDGTARGRRVTTINSLPARGSGEGVYYGGDLSKVQPEEFSIEATVNRTSLTAPYYDYPLIQHFNRATIKSGHSGYDASITGGGAVGTYTVIVSDVTPFSISQPVIIGPYTPQQESNVITAIDAGTATLTLQNALAFSHPSTGVSYVTNGLRTHTATYQTEMSVEGTRTGGDFIAHNMRIAANPVHNLGRKHCFDRTTIGYFGGDAFGLTDGVYIAGLEHHYYDKGAGSAADIFVIDSTKSFIRENDTGARGAVWLGTLYKSEGSKAANATHVISGKWKRGIDTVLADFGTDQAAMSMASGQRLFWGSTSSPDPDGFRFWSDTLGTVFVKGDADGTGAFWEANVGGFAALRVRQSGITVGGTVTSTGDMISAGSVAVNLGARINLGGSGGNTYLTYNGTHVYLVTNGGIPKQLD